MLKKDGSYHPCGNFRRLNGVTMPDKCQLPFMVDVTGILAGKTVFSKVDLVKYTTQLLLHHFDFLSGAAYHLV